MRDDPSNDALTDVIVVALAVDDPALNERVAAALAGVPEFRLARTGERADVVIADARPTTGQQLLDRADGHHSFTERELEVLTLLAEGASNKAIARRLGISVHTAKFHVGQLLDKLDATGRTDAVAHAARLGVLHL
jgi:DNA-binding CsgD family transcriptional regulator